MYLYKVNKSICSANYKRFCNNMNMKEYSERLQYAIDRRGTSQSELARAIGVKPQAIQYLCSQGKRSVHSVRIAEVLNINAKWLTDGIGEMEGGDYIDSHAVRIGLPGKPQITSNGSYLGTFEEWDNDTPLDDDEVALPFFREVEMAAGNGRHQVQENHGCKLRFSKSTLKRHGVSVDSAYCVTVSGNSMEPMMPDGCVIGVDTSITTIKNGDIYAIDHNGHLRVKVLYLMPDGRIRLRSLNSDEWPDEFAGGDELSTFKVLGRVFYGSWLR